MRTKGIRINYTKRWKQVCQKSCVMLLFIFSGILLVGCNSNQECPAQLVEEYLKSKHNPIKIETSDYSLMLTYHSPDYILAREVLNGLNSPEEIDERYYALNKYKQFEIRVEFKDNDTNKDIDSKAKRIENFKLTESDLELVVGKTTFPCILLIEEMDRGINPERKFLARFKNDAEGVMSIEFSHPELSESKIIFSKELEKQLLKLDLTCAQS